MVVKGTEDTIGKGYITDLQQGSKVVASPRPSFNRQILLHNFLTYSWSFLNEVLLVFLKVDAITVRPISIK